MMVHRKSISFIPNSENNVQQNIALAISVQNPNLFGIGYVEMIMEPHPHATLTLSSRSLPRSLWHFACSRVPGGVTMGISIENGGGEHATHEETLSMLSSQSVKLE
mmetsp:Transcript_13974/g.26160  ORF Transcript_13974/g.26160 Transcript_13974/m.26160 type:complete len:106 (+) Transcript_13974:82-399(+)